MNIAIIIIWFNPDVNAINNVKTYINLNKKIIVIDNSINNNEFKLKNLTDNYFYVSNKKNLGIAKALNIGCKLAKSEGFDFVLTMDQDSKFNNENLIKHLNDSKDIFSDKKVAILATSTEVTVDHNKLEDDFIECNSIITSGNILRLEYWYIVGGYDEKLFIDQVDHEFCYRLKRNNYKIVYNNNIKFEHNVGESFEVLFFNKKLKTTNHDWVRRYYQIRNSLFLRNKYPEYAKPFLVFVKEILLLILIIITFENNKIKKICGLYLGVKDYANGKFGSFEDRFNKTIK